MTGCEIEGCDKPVNRDGLCLPHKLKTLRFNLTRLEQEREANVTANEMKQEIFDGAKRTGQDIMQVRGRRTAHEVYKDGAWQSA